MLLLLSTIALTGSPEVPPPAPPPSATVDPPAPPPSATVDVKALFEAPPAEGERRCRSLTPDVAFLTRRYVGGPVPPPGSVVGTARWIIDGTEVETVAYRSEVPDAPAAVDLQVLSSEELSHAANVGETTRTRERVAVVRTDGGPIRGEARRLELTWTCEETWFLPRP